MGSSSWPFLAWPTVVMSKKRMIFAIPGKGPNIVEYGLSDRWAIIKGALLTCSLTLAVGTLKIGLRESTSRLWDLGTVCYLTRPDR